MKTCIAKALFYVGASLIIFAALALPYVVYIASRFGVSDSRISSVPLGMLAIGAGYALMKLAGYIGLWERK